MPHPAAGKRIAILSTKRGGGHINDPIHRGFFDYAKALGGTLFWVGPGEEYQPHPEVIPEFCRRNGVDLAIVNMKKRVDKWLPPAVVVDLPCRKVIVEVDYCYEKGKPDAVKWYEDCRFDVVFFRHFIDYRDEGLSAPKGLLPFSVHPSWICHPMDGQRQGIGFAGTVAPVAHYEMRRWALDVLKDMVVRPPRKVFGERYMRWWSQFVIGLTCSSAAHYDNAKHLIIPAAGALLLTDGSPGLSGLLPPHTWLQYTKDPVELRDTVRAALADTNHTMSRRIEAYNHVKAHHTHRVRWASLLEAV